MRESGLFELAAAYDIDEEALKKAQEEDGAQPVESYEKLLNYPDLQAIVISTGAKFHAEQIIAAAEKGLHIFVEKPLCANPKEIKQIEAAQKRYKVVIGVGHSDHSSDPISKTIKNMLDNGELGKIATFEKTTAHSGGHFIKSGDWRGDPKKNPGGMLFQCGVHGIHELIYYFGPIKSVSAVMRNNILETKTSDVALTHLQFQTGLAGCLNAYHVTPYRHSFSIFGTKANLYRYNYFFSEGTKLYKQIDHLDGKEQPRQEVTVEETEHVCGNLQSFYNAVRYGGQPYPSWIDGARAVAVVFAAEIAAKTGKRVNLSDKGY